MSLPTLRDASLRDAPQGEVVGFTLLTSDLPPQVDHQKSAGVVADGKPETVG
jgi:hypothetical protein